MAVPRKRRNRKKVQAVLSKNFKLQVVNKYRKPPKEKEIDPDKLTRPPKDLEVDEFNQFLLRRRVACESRTIKYCAISTKPRKKKYLCKKQFKLHKKG